MLRNIVAGTCFLAIVLGLEFSAFAEEDAAPCGLVHEHARDTVIVFRPPSTFTICRDGAAQDSVVTGRRVYLQLAPTPASQMFDFRIHGQSGDWTPVGLSVWEDLASKIAGKLRDLDHSGETIADLVVPLDVGNAPAAPLRPLAVARTRYLADVTPRYLDALHSVFAETRELPVIAGVVKRWCGALGSDVPGGPPEGAELRSRCTGPELAEGAMQQIVDDFDAGAKKESAARNRARDAALGAIAHPEDGKGVAEAVRQLDDARVAANAVVATAHTLRESSAALARDVAALRVSLRSIDTLHPGVPTYLSTYSNEGNAELEIDASPMDAASLSLGDVPERAGKRTGRFPIIGRHYLDIEAGLGWTAGVPNVPYATVINGLQVIQTKPVDEFVGLALVELELLRFAMPERPFAGVLRLPTIAIPFTRDPTQNFFIGGGLGWTGVGSVNFGPYFLREVTLRDGFAANQQLPAGTPIGAATVAGLRVGYFFSASVDLVGLFHLFVPSHAPTIDAVTGREK